MAWGYMISAEKMACVALINLLEIILKYYVGSLMEILLIRKL